MFSVKNDSVLTRNKLIIFFLVQNKKNNFFKKLIAKDTFCDDVRQYSEKNVET